MFPGINYKSKAILTILQSVGILHSPCKSSIKIYSHYFTGFGCSPKQWCYRDNVTLHFIVIILLASVALQNSGVIETMLPYTVLFVQIQMDIIFLRTIMSPELICLVTVFISLIIFK